MLQIAICDDESFYREKIQKLLKNYLDSHHLIYNICFFCIRRRIFIPK